MLVDVMAEKKADAMVLSSVVGKVVALVDLQSSSKFNKG